MVSTIVIPEAEDVLATKKTMPNLLGPPNNAKLSRPAIWLWAGTLAVFVASLLYWALPGTSSTVMIIPLLPTKPDWQAELPMLGVLGDDPQGYAVLTESSTGQLSIHDVLKARHSNHSGKKTLPKQKVHLNTASMGQLQTLPGVGPKMAMRILTYRKSLGGHFSSVNQLLDIKGIGQKTLAKLTPYCVLD